MALKDEDLLNQVKRAGMESAVMTQEEIQRVTQQEMQYAQQIKMQQRGQKFLAANPDIAANADLFMTELSQEPNDPDDPTFEKRFQKAASRVRRGIKAVDKEWHKKQEVKYGSGLALNPHTGQLVESVPGPDVPVETEETAGSEYAKMQRARRGNMRKTFANTGEV